MTCQVDGRRGKGCDPAAQVNAILESRRPDRIRVQVDTDDDADMISLLLSRRGFEAGVDSDGRIIFVEGSRPEGTEQDQAVDAGSLARESPGLLVMISGTGFGCREDALGRALLKEYLWAAARPGCRPQVVILIHQGVCLPGMDTEIRAALTGLGAGGTRVLFCETSLGAFDISLEDLPGMAASMPEISRALNRAGSILRV